MAKKRKHDRVAEEREGERKATPAPAKVFSSPFKDLKKMLADRERVLAEITADTQAQTPASAYH